MFPGRILSVTLVLLWLASPGRQRGQPGAMVYYVALDGDDRNSGTAQRPWRHIEWAMTRPFLRGGDTIRVRGGVYRPTVDSFADDTLIRPIASGEPGRPIMVTAESGEAVVLSGRFVAESWQTLTGPAPIYYHQYAMPLIFPFEHPFQVVEDGRLLYRVASLEGLDRPGRCFVDPEARRIYIRTSDGLSPSTHLIEFGASASGVEFRSGVTHWKLAGFAVTGFRTTGVLIAGGAGSIELERMNISTIGAHRPGADLSSGHAIAVYDTSGGNRIRENNLHHTLAEAVHISQIGAGGDLYENNDIHDAGGPEWFHEGHTGRTLTGPGLILRGNGVTVRGNRFRGNGYHGLTLESDLSGSEGPAAPAQNVIEQNVFELNGGNGLYGDGKNGPAASAGNVIRFNLFDRNNQARPGSSGDAELRLAGNWDDTLLSNNTIYSELANGIMLAAGRLSNGTAQGADALPERTRMINNIVFHAARSQTYPLRAVDVSPESVSDYNNWHRPSGGTLVSWNGAEFSSLENFSRATGRERRGMSVDPRFVSVESGHFWLRAVSPVIGRGLDAADLGAFPYRPLVGISPPEVRFVFLEGARNPPSQMLTIASTAGIPLRFAAQSAGGSWLGLSASAGQTTASVAVTVQAAGLKAGSYGAVVQFSPAIEGEPPVSVPVNVKVLPAPPRRRP